jgi:hypothetical protein
MNLNNNIMKKNLNINILVFDDKSVSIRSKEFELAYFETNPPEWFGGLQCNFAHDSKEYKDLQTKLVKLAETILKEIIEL